VVDGLCSLLGRRNGQGSDQGGDQGNRPMTRLIRSLGQYLGEIKLGKAVLWCYLIWYLVTVCFHFEASPKLWLNSAGISLVIGTGLMLSVATRGSDPWQTVRLYLMPFCVSSFAALIKGQGFIVFISPRWEETAIALLCCILFLGFVLMAKRLAQRT
jgi:hypothetical protein